MGEVPQPTGRFFKPFDWNAAPAQPAVEVGGVSLGETEQELFDKYMDGVYDKAQLCFILGKDVNEVIVLGNHRIV